MTTAARRIWGWFFFDWASQPYNTLLLTFIFGPYLISLLGSGAAAQSIWGYAIGTAGLVVAVLSPLLGSVVDRCGHRTWFILFFSVLYVFGAWGLWWAAPGNTNLWFVLICLGIGLIGMEFATSFTNAMLPDLGTPEQIGRISGSGWAFGYVGGVVSLILVLALIAERPTGLTLIGIPPILGLDPALREGTRAVGPFTALWYIIFMVPFFLWVREPRRADSVGLGTALRHAWPDLKATLRSLPGRRSLSAFLLSSMFYRDALNGIFVFGGIYAAGVLGWSVVDVGVFGILAAITGAVFAWVGGRADSRFGPRAVVVTCILVLTAVTAGIALVSRESVFGLAVPPESRLPDLAFYILGALIGAAGGALQSSSRTMMVRQADPARITEGFGLYALTGKATSFIAPWSVSFATDLTGSQAWGITPLILLFGLGLVLLIRVKANGDREGT
jgi:UMF1 family MFS transporter